MRLLELFAGTGSVRKAVGSQFDEIISLDIDPAHNPTIVCDILEWNYKIYPSGYFDVIWASPPCTEFSCLNFTHPEKIPNLNLADSIVKKTIEIIDYFNPSRFFIENPQSGSLKERDYMYSIPYADFDYCQFCNWGYRKRTRIWTCTNAKSKLCPGANHCENMINKRHKFALGNNTYNEFWVRGTERIHQRYAIPPALVQYLFSSLE